MITMITGIPGMGKTSLLVSMLIKEAQKGERPLFVMGIPDLNLEHNVCPPIEEWTHKKSDPNDPTLMLDYYSFPPNSILVIDEAQRVFRSRSSSSKVPAIVSALETHRHTGLDIWLLTQKPLLIDSHVRELTQRHIHIKPTLLGRYLYEWPDFNDVNNKSNLADAAKRRFTPPKQSFSLYTSSQKHTKQPKRFHQAFIVLALSIISVATLAYNLSQSNTYKIITHQNESKKEPIQAINTPQSLITEQPILQNSLYKPETTQLIIHPYLGFDFVIKGTLHSKRFNKTYFELTQGTNSLLLTDDDLKKLGYSITQLTDCSAFLFFNGAQIIATCEKPAADYDARQGVDVGNRLNALDVFGGVIRGETPNVDAFNIPPNSHGMTSRSSPVPSPAT